MLGLGEQVDRHPVGIGRRIGDDQHFRRPRHHVDADGAEDAALCSRHVSVAGADNLVYLRDGLRAVGQRSDGLRTTKGEHAIDADQACGSQHQRILLATRRRHHHDQFADAGHLGRQGIHQHRARICRLAARHIQADAIQRRDLLSESRAIGFREAPRFEFLPLVIIAYPLRCGFKRRALRRREPVQRPPQFAPGKLQFGHGTDVELIKATRVIEHRGVTLAADPLKNFGDRRFDGIVGRMIEMQQRVERGQKARITGRQAANHRMALSIALITGCSNSRFIFSAA